MIKLENQMYADFVNLVKSALVNFEVNDWKVCQLNQPLKFTETAPVVYLSVENIRKTGMQFARKNAQGQYFQAYKEEISVRIAAMRRNLAEDLLNTLGAGDVLKLISSWLVSPAGLSQVKALGYSIFNPSDIKPVIFKTDSDNKVIMPSFNITFNIEQSWDTSVEDISEYKLKMKGI